jgi:hypothetical protein
MLLEKVLMPTWAIVIGAALGGGILLFVTVVFLIRRFLRKLVSGLTAMAEASTPVRIKTVPKPAAKRWNNPEAVAKAREFFEEQSFDWVSDVGLWSPWKTCSPACW